MDGDNTHDPKYIIDMVDKIQDGYDVVIASRYTKILLILISHTEEKY